MTISLVGNIEPAELVEYGLNQFYLTIARKGNIPWGKEPSCTWVINKVTGWPSFITEIRIPSGSLESETEKLVLKIRNGILPDRVIVSDHHGSELLNALVRASFVPIHSWAGMWCNTDMLSCSYASESIRIEEITDIIQAGNFAGIVNDILFGRTSLSAEMIINSAGKELLYYLIYFGENLAGTIAMYLKDSWCGIYLVTVKPEFRRRGIALAATALGLARAKEAGCRQFILHASKMGEPVYAKLGFTVVSKIWILQLSRK